MYSDEHITVNNLVVTGKTMKSSLYAALMSLLLASITATLAIASPPREVKGPGPEPRVDAGGVLYWGVVTEVTKTSITLKFEDDPPKCFPVSPILTAGEIPMLPRPIPTRNPNLAPQPYDVDPTEMYRLADVKLGDWVCVSYSKIGGTITCEHLRIQKRPGGLVPPLPKEAEELRHFVTRWKLQHPGEPVPEAFALIPPPIPYHEYMNAYWDLEDKGIPFPEKFGDERRWLTAPMPREVLPKPAPKL
jgi:hypothetical protein